jgi:CrcB protein
MIEVLPDTTGAMHWPTFLANVLGAFLLGWFVTRMAPTVRRNELVLPFFAIGLFGSLTTFSALMVEIVESSRAGLVGGAAAYGAASVLIGLGAAAAGITLARVGR